MENRLNKMCIKSYTIYGKHDISSDDYKNFKHAIDIIYVSEIKDNLDSLRAMWNQYCSEEGHYHMSAGEGCSAILQEYGLLDGEFGEAKDVF